MDFEYWEELQKKRKAEQKTLALDSAPTPAPGPSPDARPAPAPAKKSAPPPTSTPAPAPVPPKKSAPPPVPTPAPAPAPAPNQPFSIVPAELKELSQWVMWRYQPTKNGKKTKVPYQPNGSKAETDNDSTWNAFYFCVKVHNTRNFDGIGFVFRASDPYLGVDIDDCIADGQLKAWAIPIVAKLKPVSYAEISPSRTGIKFWTKAVVGDRACVIPVQDGKLEIFDDVRYFTVTGIQGRGTPTTGQAVIDWIYDTYDIKAKPKHKNATSLTIPSTGTMNLPLIEQIRKSKVADKFDRLMAGNFDDYESHSHADWNFCLIIASYTDNPYEIDGLMRQSGLMRGKWDEVHWRDGARYGERTIQRAIESKSGTRRKRKEWLPRQVYRYKQSLSEKGLSFSQILKNGDGWEILDIKCPCGTEGCLGTLNISRKRYTTSTNCKLSSLSSFLKSIKEMTQ